MLAVTLATLTLSGSPPVLKGAHFKPHELVRVFVPGPSGLIKVRATLNGTFLIHIPETPWKSKAVVVQAFGTLGSKATIYVGVPTGAGTGSGVAKPGDPTK